MKEALGTTTEAAKELSPQSSATNIVQPSPLRRLHFGTSRNSTASESSSSLDGKASPSIQRHHTPEPAANQHEKLANNKGLALLVLGILGTQFPESLDKE